MGTSTNLTPVAVRSGAVHIQIDHDTKLAYVVNVNGDDATGVACTRNQLRALANSLRYAADAMVPAVVAPFTDHHRCAADDESGRRS